MSLNIKNPRVHELARRAAQVTGKTQTGAIEEALERLLRAYDADPDQAEAEHRIEVVRRIVAEYAADQGKSPRELNVVDDLYDDAGLPR